MEKRKVKFTKEGRYSLHPAFGPTLDVLIGDEYTLNKSNVDQIVADKWGDEIIEEEDLGGSDDLDDGDFVDPNLGDDDKDDDIDDEIDEVKWPTEILDRFITDEIDEKTAKDLLEEKAKSELAIDINRQKSVANTVSELLIEIEIQEENDD